METRNVCIDITFKSAPISQEIELRLRQDRNGLLQRRRCCSHNLLQLQERGCAIFLQKRLEKLEV
jgi:hypothetical protein